MILNGLRMSIRQLSYAHPSSGVLLLDDKNLQTNYDVLISDICQDDLSGVISKVLGKKNLTPLSSNEQEFSKRRKGMVFGHYNRGIISLRTRFEKKQPIWVHYLVDTGSPFTFLSAESVKFLTDSQNI